tara:strand:+ start:549 stop:1610 length:1062 start_codon:yes stop_codon:yes gene_type:complete
MPEKKKQHYMPTLLRKHFAIDQEKKLINLYQIDANKVVNSCPLRDHAQEDYFYGKDGIIENALGELEDLAAPIIKRIVDDRFVPVKGTDEYQILFTFCFFQAYRTTMPVKEANENINKLYQEIGRQDKRFEDITNGKFAIQIDWINISLRHAAKALPYAFDLDLMIIENNSSTKFITSDNPAVKYNQYLEMKKFIWGQLGMLSKGLQIFFPIAPDMMLVYYDSWAYKFGNKKDKLVNLVNDKDADQLNLLQIINSDKVVFFNNELNNSYICNIAERKMKLRKEDLTKMRKTKVSEEGNAEGIIYISSNNNKGFNLNLSFVKFPKHAKKHALSDHMVQLRREELRFLIEELVKN